MTEFSIEPSSEGQSLDYDSTLEDSCYDEPPLVSDRVHNLANNIYQEFESMMEKYGNNVVEKLMPLIIGMLESMDQLYADKHRLDIELELIKEDKDQVIAQYEREKCLKKSAEEKLLKFEDENDGMKKELESKIESLESILKVMELKAKNSQEHVSRFEEKELELKKDYNHLHERYADLFRSHMEYIDRTKVMLQQQSLHPIPPSASSSVSHKMKSNDRSSAAHKIEKNSPVGFDTAMNDCGDDSALNSQFCTSDEFEHDSANKELGGWETAEFHRPLNKSSDDNKIIQIEETEDEDTDFATAMAGMETMNENFLTEGNDYEDFLKFDDVNSTDEFDETGVSREIENLIRENTELIETKHALNIVKDDLISKLDDLTGENMMFKEEITSFNTTKETFKERICELEKSNRAFRDELESVKQKLSEYERDDSSHVDSVESKQFMDASNLTKNRFTRTEMASILQERNMFKERLFELQESVRLAEELRAKRHEEKQNRSSESEEGDDWNVLDQLWSPLLGASISGGVDIQTSRSDKNTGINAGSSPRQKSLLSYFSNFLWDTVAPPESAPNSYVTSSESTPPSTPITKPPSSHRMKPHPKSPHRRQQRNGLSSVGGISLWNSPGTLQSPVLPNIRRSPGSAQRLSRSTTGQSRVTAITNPLLSVASPSVPGDVAASCVATSTTSSIRLLADEVHLLPVNAVVDECSSSPVADSKEDSETTCNGLPFDV